MALKPLNNSHITTPLLWLAGALVVFLAGCIFGNRTSIDSVHVSLQQERQYTEMDLQNRQLSDEVRLLSAQRYSDEQTIRDLQSALTDSRLTRSRERQELALFKNLSNADNKNKGIAINGMTISELGQQRFAIEWRLTQPRGRKRVNGDQTVVIEGRDSSGEYRSINISELSVAPDTAQHTGSAEDAAAGLAATELPPGWIDRQVVTNAGMELRADEAADLLGAGEVLSLHLPDIATALGKYPDFDFRYLENFFATVELPSGFSPELIGFAVEPRAAYSPSIKPVARLFPWRTNTDIVDASNE